MGEGLSAGRGGLGQTFTIGFSSNKTTGTDGKRNTPKASGKESRAVKCPRDTSGAMRCGQL